MELHFMFLSYQTYLVVSGVFGDDPVEVKSVTEGDSVTLHTDVVKQRDDLIVWYYGPVNTVVAMINREANNIKFSDDEIFKDRLKMNQQTGDLTINDITSQHSGLYTLRIRSNNKVSHKNFNLTVSGRLPFPPLNQITKPTKDLDNTELNNKSSESPDQRLIVITAVSCTAVVCVSIIISIIIIYMKKKKVPKNSSNGRNIQTDDKSSMNTSRTSKDEVSRCLKEKQHWIGTGIV